MGIYDVPADMLLNNIAADFKAKVKAPGFVKFVKTGAHKERSPINPDWFYVRTASILYRVYKDGPVGTGALRSYYGGRKNRGVRPEKKYRAGGKAIRLGLQILEKEGLVKKDKKGRIVTPKGEKYLFAKALEVQKVYNEEMKKGQETQEQDRQRREQLKAKRAEALATPIQHNPAKKETQKEAKNERGKPETKKT